MLDKVKIIQGLNKSCKMFFAESSFFLHPSTTNRFKVSGNNLSTAINNYNGYREEVKVLKWFEDFWIYVDLKFEDQNTFISISIFQGSTTDPYKHQLFRAEWDDYNNAEEKHPQPHWHITSNQAIEKTFEELAELSETDTFLNVLQEEKSKIIDLNKFHFAMIGNWINDETHVHSLNSEERIIKWFQGILSHMKLQLEYLR